MPGRELVHLTNTGEGHGTQFGGKINLFLNIAVIKWFYANGIAGEHKIITIKDREGKHPVQFFHTFWPLFLIKL